MQRNDLYFCGKLSLNVWPHPYTYKRMSDLCFFAAQNTINHNLNLLRKLSLNSHGEQTNTLWLGFMVVLLYYLCKFQHQPRE